MRVSPNQQLRDKIAQLESLEKMRDLTIAVKSKHIDDAEKKIAQLSGRIKHLEQVKARLVCSLTSLCEVIEHE